MIRKLVVISGFVLIATALGVLIWLRPMHSLDSNASAKAQGLDNNISVEVQAVKDTILRSLRIDAEAAYTFDTSKLSTVYINDPRGGETPPEVLAYIQEVRQDPSIKADQVGELDYKQAVIERRKRDYDLFMANLRAKQAAGTLSEAERIMLEGETNGWPTPVQEAQPPEVTPTQPCARSPITAAYPDPNPLPTCGPPVPTPTLQPYPLVWLVPHRGINPETLPPKSFEIDILSVKIEGDVAKAVVQKSSVTSEMALVKVDGQWYIAGGRLIKSVAP